MNTVMELQALHEVENFSTRWAPVGCF